MKTHQQVIQQFVAEGRGGRGTYVTASEADEALYSTYGRRWEQANKLPLAVRLDDGGFVANGARLDWPMSRHQDLALKTLHSTESRFGVVPFPSTRSRRPGPTAKSVTGARRRLPFKTSGGKSRSSSPPRVRSGEQ